MFISFSEFLLYNNIKNRKGRSGVRLFLSTLACLTILPVPSCYQKKLELSKGILYYTLIGLLIGLIDYLCYGIAIFFLKLSWIGAICAVLSETIVTGGLHLNGLASICDGFVTTNKKEKMLEKIKNKKIGTNGALALIFTIVLKIVLLENSGYLAVLLAPVAGKIAIPILIKSSSDKQQTNTFYVTPKYTKYMIGTIFIGIALLAGFLQIKSILPIVTILLSAFLFREYWQQKNGGMTEDALGAGYELSEMVFLIIMTLQGGIL